MRYEILVEQSPFGGPQGKVTIKDTRAGSSFSVTFSQDSQGVIPGFLRRLVEEANKAGSWRDQPPLL